MSRSLMTRLIRSFSKCFWINRALMFHWHDDLSDKHTNNSSLQRIIIYLHLHGDRFVRMCLQNIFIARSTSIYWRNHFNQCSINLNRIEINHGLDKIQYEISNVFHFSPPIHRFEFDRKLACSWSLVFKVSLKKKKKWEKHLKWLSNVSKSSDWEIYSFFHSDVFHFVLFFFVSNFPFARYTNRRSQWQKCKNRADSKNNPTHLRQRENA